MEAHIKLISSFQPLFINPPKTRYYVLTGGRGSSKSWHVAVFLLNLTYEKGHVILFTRYTLTAANISIIPEFIEKIEMLNLEEDFYITKNEIVNLKTESKILFKGIKTSSGTQTANLKSLSGVTTFVVEEAEELTDEKTFDKIDFSVRAKSIANRVILILNPTSKEHWIYERFFQSKGIKEGSNITTDYATYIHTTYLDNINNLSQSFINQVEEMKNRRPEKFKHQILGGWLDKAEGVVFTNWSFGEFNPDGLQTSCGMDFGFSVDPDTLTEVAIDKAKKKLYVKEHIYQNGIKTHELAPMILSKVGDKLIIADSAEPRLIEDLRHLKVNIQAVKKGTIQSGISRMQDFEIIVEPNSSNIAKELNNYAYKDKGSQLYIDDWNHCFVGETLITTNAGEIPIKDIEVGSLVLTSKGYNRVLKKFHNGLKQVCTYSLQFDTFSLSLSCTKDHRIKTEKGWIEISKLQKGDKIYLHKSLTEKNTTYTKERDTLVRGGKGCIQKSGSITKERFQRDTTFTISTETLKTIGLRTLLWLRSLCTLDLKVKSVLRKTLSGLKSFIKKELNPLKRGTSQKRVESGIRNTEGSLGRIENTKQRPAKSAEKNTKQDIAANHYTAITTAKLERIDVVESREEMVFDLMVEDCHEYFANGILVHNCIDGVRYNVIYHLDNPNLGNYNVY